MAQSRTEWFHRGPQLRYFHSVAIRFRLRSVLPILIAVALIGCGGGALNSNHHHTDGGTDSGSTTSTTTSGTTGASGVLVSHTKGGSVHDAGGVALVVIPPNSMAEDTKIFVTPATVTPSAPDGTQLLTNTAFDLTPTVYFNIPASLTLTYNPSTIPAGMPENAIRIYTVVNGNWEPVSGAVVSPTYHSISVPLAHFGTYAALCEQSLSSGPSYDVIDCGVLDGDVSSIGLGISSDGKAVGQSTSAALAPRGFLYQSGFRTDLKYRPTDIGGKANAVNATGLAGGASYVNLNSTYPVKLSYGSVEQVRTQFGFTPGAITALNDAGSYVVGNALARSTTVTPFSPFNVAVGSGALNSNDEVAGATGDHAAFWKSSGVEDIGVLKDYDIAAGTAISDDETVVGVAYKTGESARVGFIYRSGQMSRIPMLGGDTNMVPTGVNALGQVVGNSKADLTTRGFFYSNSNTVTLDSLIPSSSGWQIVQANAINNMGQIVGTGISREGAQHAVILVPRPGR